MSYFKHESSYVDDGAVERKNLSNRKCIEIKYGGIEWKSM